MTSLEITLPGVPERGVHARGLGLELLDWEGTSAFGHDGDVPGQGTVWRVVPEHGLVVAMSATNEKYTAFFDELLDQIVPESTGLTVPPRPTPPGGPRQPGPSDYAGRYSYPMSAYEVTATDDGLDVTAIPHPIPGLPAEPTATARFVHLNGSTFVAAEPDHGIHRTITFLDDGRYLFGGRVAPREG
jgi:hypothetical protein